MTEIYLKVVKRTLEIIDTEDKWCNNAPARTKDGEYRSDYLYKDAYSFSLVSALERACEDVDEETNEIDFYFEQYHNFMTWLYSQVNWHGLDEQLNGEFNVRDQDDENHADNIMKHIKATRIEINSDMTTLCRDFFEAFSSNPGIEYRHIRGILEQVLQKCAMQ